jgi:hypothetical protein
MYIILSVELVMDLLSKKKKYIRVYLIKIILIHLSKSNLSTYVFYFVLKNKNPKTWMVSIVYREYLTLCHPYGWHLFNSHPYECAYIFVIAPRTKQPICHFVSLHLTRASVDWDGKRLKCPCLILTLLPLLQLSSTSSTLPLLMQGSMTALAGPLLLAPECGARWEAAAARSQGTVLAELPPLAPGKQSSSAPPTIALVGRS